MSSSPLVLSSQPPIRPVTTYVPDVWGVRFHNYEPESLEERLVTEKKIGKLKEEVRNMLLGSTKNLCRQLELIDDIQRLGVGYHFEGEIEEALENIYATYLDGGFKNRCMDLNHASLCFRLLRQQGIRISTDIFKSFQDDNGVFKQSLRTDVEGLLSLYEAAFLGIRGETVLDEALIFSTAHLEASSKHGTDILSKMVAKALHRPLRKSLARVSAAHFISIYKDRPTYNETLGKFAVLDFNHLQSIHKKELSDLRKWGSDSGFKAIFPFARDRMVECYFWISAIGFKAECCLARKIISKLLCLVSIMDDLYDSYGTFEELSLLTAAIKRWSCDVTNDLPECMKIYHQAFLDWFAEIEELMIEQGTSYRIPYAKEAVEKQVEAYLKEAEWCNKKYNPTMEEYLAVSMMSSGYALISIMWSVCMAEDAVTEQDFQWLRSQPKIVVAIQVICRLMDDIVSEEREKEKSEHVATALDIYTAQHGVTTEEAVRVFRDRVSDAWKDINQEFLKPTAVEMNHLSRIIPLAQIIDEWYKDEDSYSVAGKSVKDGISALFINQVSL